MQARSLLMFRYARANTLCCSFRLSSVVVSRQWDVAHNSNIRKNQILSRGPKKPVSDSGQSVAMHTLPPIYNIQNSGGECKLIPRLYS